MDYSAIAKEIIRKNLYVTLATSLHDTPWITPVVYAVDGNFTFYWSSAKDTRHSHIIAENPKVSCVIFDSQSQWGEGEAVYIEATATEVEEDEIAQAVEELFTKRWKQFRPDKTPPVYKTETFSGDAPWRMYKAVPQKVWLLSNQTKREENGKLIDAKIEVQLKA